MEFTHKVILKTLLEERIAVDWSETIIYPMYKKGKKKNPRIGESFLRWVV